MKFIRLVIAGLLLSCFPQSIHAQGIVFIESDGTGCPGIWNAVQKICTLTSNVFDSFVLNGEITLDCGGYSIANPGGLDFGIFTDYPVKIENCDVLNYPIGIYARGTEVKNNEDIVVTGSRIRRTDLSTHTAIHFYAKAVGKDIWTVLWEDTLIEDMLDAMGPVSPDQTSTGIYIEGLNAVINGLTLSGDGIGTSLFLVDSERIDLKTVDSLSLEYGAVLLVTDPNFQLTPWKVAIRDSLFMNTNENEGQIGIAIVTPKEHFEMIEMDTLIENTKVSGFETNLWFQYTKNLTILNTYSMKSPTSALFGGTHKNTNVGYFKGDGTVRFETWYQSDVFQDFYFYGGNLHYKNKAPRDEFDQYAFTTFFIPGTAIEVFIAGNDIKMYPSAFRLGGDSSGVNIGWNNLYPVLAYDYTAESMPFIEGFEWCKDERCLCLGNYRLHQLLQPTYDPIYYTVGASCLMDQHIPTKICGPKDSWAEFIDGMYEWGLFLEKEDAFRCHYDDDD